MPSPARRTATERARRASAHCATSSFWALIHQSTNEPDIFFLFSRQIRLFIEPSVRQTSAPRLGLRCSPYQNRGVKSESQRNRCTRTCGSEGRSARRQSIAKRQGTAKRHVAAKRHGAEAFEKCSFARNVYVPYVKRSVISDVCIVSRYASHA